MLFRYPDYFTLGQVLYEDVLHHVKSAMAKSAGTPKLSYSMAGRLYLSKSGWLLLTVPAALVRGIFDALHEPGLELPPSQNGTLNAHISVMRPDEIAAIGGPDKIVERGHIFRYTLGPVYEVEPAGWENIGKVWLVEVHSPELERLRRSYGLSSLPNGGKYKFHITVAVRRRNVLRNTEDAVSR
jgi:hypothetical protein